MAYRGSLSRPDSVNNREGQQEIKERERVTNGLCRKKELSSCEVVRTKTSRAPVFDVESVKKGAFSSGRRVGLLLGGSKAS